MESTPASSSHVTLLITSIVLGLVVALVLFAGARGLDQRRLHQEFDTQATARVTALRRNLDAELGVLDAIKAFLETTPDVDADRFAAFTGQLMTKAKGAQASGWVPRVKDVDREQFERDARARGLVDFDIRERSAAGEMIV